MLRVRESRQAAQRSARRFLYRAALRPSGLQFSCPYRVIEDG
jgi:hypothetical protein